MRKILEGIGALSLTALSFAYCSSDPVQGSTDLGVPTADLATAATDDLSTVPDQQPAADMLVPVPTTDFVVLRIGDGNSTLTSAATAGFIERRKIADGSIVGQPLALPTAVSGANKQLTFSGLATNEGYLSRSTDGKYLLVAGYAANPGVKSVADSASATNNRVVGRITAANVIDTTTAFNSFSGSGMRGVASTNGTDLWVSSDGGIGYTTFGKTDPLTLLSVSVVRAVEIFKLNNVQQLFVSTNSTPPGITTVGTGTPMAVGQTLTALSGFTAANSPSPYGYVAFDRDGNGSIDQLYVADDTVVAKGGVQRWKLTGTTWSLDGTISTGAGAGARTVTGSFVNNTVTLLAVTAEGTGVQPRVLSLTDTGGATTTVTSKVLVTAGANTTYRGIALVAQ